MLPSTAPLKTSDGLTLHQRDWPVLRPRARVLLVHGLGEHSGRYARLASELNAAGIAVRGYDQRGHGHSQGERGVLGSQWDALPRDVCDVFARYARESDDLPFLFGHSLGGLVAMYAVMVLELRPRGLVASAPALASHASALERRLARWVSAVRPHQTLRNGLPADRLSHDPQVERLYRDDPLNHDRISARLAHFIFEAGPKVIARAGQLHVPTLLQIAGDDALVDAAGARAFAEAAVQRRLQVHDYRGLYHEIYNEAEPERSRVVADLLRWLDLQLS
ncbi:lysophospholipase [Pseudoxanthomonas putridarboris]|uniref:Lysophospholipase n=1 Tax=Pseudoxanthomonas putridarboris TaxID=752605 RepID=A0ABU9J4C7_9GAMM